MTSTTTKENAMFDIQIINSAADATMNPAERDLFDQFDDDTKQRFLNQILVRAEKYSAETESAK
jgi:hypothetical protein